MRKSIFILNRFFILFAILFGMFTTSLLAANTNISYAYDNSLAFNSEVVRQQQIEVSGTVQNTQGEPLPGVNIVIEGTTQGTTTNVDGEFSIECSTDATLVFSFVGYRKQAIPVEGQEEINVILEQDVQRLEEVVAIGYGTAQKKDVSGSIASVQAEDIANREMSNVLEMLRGTVAGFSSTTSTGPGGGGSMKVRGTTSIMASSNPLIVLDGTIFRGSIDEINPQDIESINVLKDASAAAVYGARAAAGVIEITTKRGTTDKPTINISSSVGWAETGIDQDPFNPQEYATFRRDERRQTYTNKPENYFTNPNELPSGVSLEEWENMDPAAQGSPEEIWLNRIGFKSNEIENYLAGNSTNWYDQVLQKGLRQNYNVSVSGKREDLSYFTSMQYIDNQGMRVNNRYRTLRGRVNLDYRIADFLTVGTNTQFENTNDGFLGASVQNAIWASPWGDKYNEDGTLKWYTNTDAASPNPFLYKMRDYYDMHRSLRSNIYGKIDLPAGFAIETRWVNRMAFGQTYGYTPSIHPSAASAGGSGYRSESTSWDWNVDNLLTWNDTIADVHQFDVTFLYNVEKMQNWYTSASNQTFRPNEKLIYNNIASGLSPQVGSNDNLTTGDALMGRINYRLMDRYLLTLSMRRDGYSAFGGKHPHAWFPAASAGWRISEENFFTSDWLNNLKLRLSYGVNGNRSIGGYAALATLGTTKYIYGSSSYSGIYASTMANPDLKWERTASYNIGLDFGMFSGRLSGSLNAYYQTTDDLLLNRSLPQIVGYDDIMANLGQVDNRGLELELRSVNVDILDKFLWKSSMTFSLNRNEIVHLYGNEVPIKNDAGEVIGYKEASDWTNGWYIGHSLHAIRDYQLTHVYGTDEAEEAQRYGRRPGDFAVKDVNDDGTLQPKDDYVFQGKTVPQYRINLINSFTLWQNLEVSFHLRTLLDYKGVNNQHLNSSWRTPRANKYDHPYWTEQNQRDQWAALTLSKAASGGTAYNYYEDRSFVRMQNLSIAYSIPDNLIQNSALKNLKVYFNLENGPTFTNWTHWDPETDDPTPRIFTFGVNATL